MRMQVARPFRAGDISLADMYAMIPISFRSGNRGRGADLRRTRESVCWEDALDPILRPRHLYAQTQKY